MLLKLLVVIVAYLIGAIPTGYLVGRRLGGIDIRRYGSGNIGFTNVLRVLGPGPGIITLLGDVGKGFLAAKLGFVTGGPNLAIITGLTAIAGHSWPVYLGFKGGKIIATGFGVLLALAWQVALLALALWLIVFLLSRYVSLASIVAAVSVPVSMVIWRESVGLILFGLVAAAVALYKHRDNIRRLRQGTEHRFGRR
ncbi:MAG: acyl phosphate:glycerol-3-phosphate acyltransferase [Eubacteriales bacterium]|nr:acyl phosphate:glycerol-3-phosphate acyltransferase [Eubacteriales bacterium]